MQDTVANAAIPRILYSVSRILYPCSLIPLKIRKIRRIIIADAFAFEPQHGLYFKG